MSVLHFSLHHNPSCHNQYYCKSAPPLSCCRSCFCICKCNNISNGTWQGRVSRHSIRPCMHAWLQDDGDPDFTSRGVISTIVTQASSQSIQRSDWQPIAAVRNLFCSSFLAAAGNICMAGLADQCLTPVLPITTYGCFESESVTLLVFPQLLRESHGHGDPQHTYRLGTRLDFRFARFLPMAKSSACS